jgi:hypothetical protein
VFQAEDPNAYVDLLKAYLYRSPEIVRKVAKNKIMQYIISDVLMVDKHKPSQFDPIYLPILLSKQIWKDVSSTIDFDYIFGKPLKVSVKMSNVDVAGICEQLCDFILSNYSKIMGRM